MMSDLADTVRALDVIHRDLSTIEKAAKVHSEADDSRFQQLQGEHGMAGIHATLSHLGNVLNVLQDQMIDGFRQLGARIERVETKRGKNGS
jgi:hypothetical protein